MLTWKKIATTAVLALGLGGPKADALTVAATSSAAPYLKAAAAGRGGVTVKGMGAGDAVAAFCAHEPSQRPDIIAMPREMNPEERRACDVSGVGPVIGVTLGYEAAALVTGPDGPAIAMTPATLFSALAAQVPTQGRLAPNRSQDWSDVAAGLPPGPVDMLVPGKKNPLRDLFAQTGMSEGCRMFGTHKLFRAAEGDSKGCAAYRTDGRVREVAGDDGTMIAALRARPHAVAVIGLAHVPKGYSVLRYRGALPTAAAVISGDYDLSRPIHLYVAAGRVAQSAPVEAFLGVALSDAVAGPSGALSRLGLVPPGDLGASRAQIARAAR